MGHARERFVALTKKFPRVRTLARLIERATYYHRCYCICKWETSLPEQAKLDLQKSGFIARIGSEADLSRLAQTETWRSCTLYRDWLRSGKKILLLEKNAQIMSYVWLNFNREFVVEQVPEMCFRMPSDTYFSDEAYTPVAYRGLGLRRLSFIAELLFAQENGFRFMISYFLNDRAKTNAMQNFVRTGNARGKVIKEVHLLKIAGFDFSSVKDVVKDQAAIRIR